MSDYRHSRIFRRVRWMLVLVVCVAAGAGLRRWQNAPRMAGSHAAANRVSAGAPGLPGGESTSVAQVIAAPRNTRLVLLAAMLPSAGEAELKALMEGLLTEGTSIAETEAEWRLLFTRWAEVDAGGLLEILQAPALAARVEVRQLAVCAWAERTGPATLDVAAEQWPGMACDAAMEMVQRQPGRVRELVPWLKRNGPSVLAGLEAQAFPDLLGPARYLELAAALENQADLEVASVWMEVNNVCDPALVDGLPAGRARDFLLHALLTSMARHLQREQFKEAYHALPPGMVRDALGPEYVRMITEEDPLTAADAALQLPKGEARTLAIGKLAEQIEGQMPEQAMDFYAALWEDTVENASADFKAELRTETEVMVNNRHWVVNRFEDWLARDSDRAMAWTETVRNAELRSELIFRAALGGFKVVPENIGAAERQLIGRYASAETAVPDAWREAAKVSDKMQDGLTKAEWAEATAEERRHYFQASMNRAGEEGQAETQAEARLAFFHEAAPDDRPLQAWSLAAASMLESSGETRTLEWVNALSPGGPRDAAATAMIHHYLEWSGQLSGEGIRQAFDLAAGMHGSVERAKFTAQAVEAWASRQPGEARSAVEASGLTDGEKAVLLARLPEGESL